MAEQSAGIVLLLALAFFSGANVEIQFPDIEDCHTVMWGEYQGRSAEGRPEYEYLAREVCDG